MVVMDRQVYVNKSNTILTQPVYRPILKDTTNKIKAKLITILRKVKNQTGLDSNTYKAMYHMGCEPVSHSILIFDVSCPCCIKTCLMPSFPVLR